MRVTLETDYRDIYDHWFDREGEVTFRRRAKESWGLGRTRMFEIFSEMGLKAPEVGRAADFCDDETIVVYLDEYAHCGDGKMLLRAADAKRLPLSLALTLVASGVSSLSKDEVRQILKSYRAHGSDETLAASMASRYVPDFKGVTWRYLYCGSYGSWFRHESFSDWRSNAGDGDLYEVRTDEVLFPKGFGERVLNPVWAIDFVAEKEVGRKPSLLAIDFNTAPRLGGTPMTKLATPMAFAEGIKERVWQKPEGKVFDNNRVLLAKL